MHERRAIKGKNQEYSLTKTNASKITRTQRCICSELAESGYAETATANILHTFIFVVVVVIVECKANDKHGARRAGGSKLTITAAIATTLSG